MLEDIAILTGGTVISEETGLTLEKATLQDLGQAKRVEDRQENTTIIGGPSRRRPIEARKQIRVQIEEATSDYDREKLQERAGQAGWRCCRDQGRCCHRSRNEGKKAASKTPCTPPAAVEEGIVAGGGVARCCVPANLAGRAKGDNPTRMPASRSSARDGTAAARNRCQCR